MEKTISILPEKKIRICAESFRKSINRQRPALLFFAALTTLLSVFSAAAAPAFLCGAVFIAAIYPYTTQPIDGNHAGKGGEQ